MKPWESRIRRGSYAYPAVGLRHAARVPVHVSFNTTTEMDSFHFRGLHSISRERVISSYLSVIYWGHYSGKAGIVRAGRALSKVRMAKMHRAYLNAYQTIRESRTLLRRNKISAAIICLTKLPQVQFAFASKLCAFLAPDRCGVIDSVIARNHYGLGFKTTPKGYVTTNVGNAHNYEQYCCRLQTEAARLNRLGHHCRWRDRDGSARNWRAVDVERSMY